MFIDFPNKISNFDVVLFQYIKQINEINSILKKIVHCVQIHVNNRLVSFYGECYIYVLIERYIVKMTQIFSVPSFSG